MLPIKKCLLPLVVALSATGAAAQDYPSHTIDMIVPSMPGGNVDLTARAFQTEFQKAVGQAVVVLNQPGAAGTLGVINMSTANPDGYTIGFMINNPMAAQIHIQNVPYDLDSFRYVCLVYQSPYILMGSPDSPFDTFEEFVTFAKEKPDNLLYGTSGPGSQAHLATLALLKAIGAEGVHVPFKGGSAVTAAMLANTVNATVNAPSFALTNNLKALATLTSKRLTNLPDVPAISELGYRDISVSPYGGIVVPAATPDDVYNKLVSACETAVRSDGYRTTISKLESDPEYHSGEEFRGMLESEAKMNAEIIKEAGLAK
jgi:tripartite-type tricarboxylate transporter receptor subunit TctC